MDKWTLLQIKTKIKEDLDLEEETFIEESELTNLINDGIDVAEAIIHSIYEDYFKTYANIALVNGTAEYSLPADIYGNKIRELAYYDGSTAYEITRYKGSMSDIPLVSSADEYQYDLVNGSSGYKIKLIPASRETSATNLTIWYLRNAKKLSAASDECDIPEFINFVIEYAKGQCMAKENGGVVPASKQAEIEVKKQLMIDTLTNRVDDGHTEIGLDLRHYNEHS